MQEKLLMKILEKLEVLDTNVLEIKADVAVVKRDIGMLKQRVSKLEQRVSALEQRFDALEQRLDALEQRVGALEQGFTSHDKKLDAIMAQTAFLLEYKSSTNARIDTIEDSLDGAAQSLAPLKKAQ